MVVMVGALWGGDGEEISFLTIEPLFGEGHLSTSFHCVCAAYRGYGGLK